MSRHKRTARLLRDTEERLRDDMWRADDADAYGHRRYVPQSVRDEANRQWDAIPTDPAEIAVWMRQPPVQP